MASQDTCKAKNRATCRFHGNPKVLATRTKIVNEVNVLTKRLKETDQKIQELNTKLMNEEYNGDTNEANNIGYSLKGYEEEYKSIQQDLKKTRTILAAFVSHPINNNRSMEPLGKNGEIPHSVKELVKAAPVYVKTAKVKAVKVTVDTPLKTVLKNGTMETERIVPAGSYIITNPDGEEYGIDSDKFAAKYDTTNEEGIFLAKGKINAIRNPYKEPISIKASWGELQHGDSKCWLAVPVDSDETPYIIGSNEFDNTYKEF